MSRGLRGIKKPSELGEATREEKSLGAAIEVLTHAQSGVSVRIRLNKETGTFGALVNGEQYKNKDVEALREEVLDTIEASLKVEWIPVIGIRIRTADDNRSYFKFPRLNDSGDVKCETSLEAERFYLAKMGFQNWRKLDWDHKEETPTGAELLAAGSVK